MATLDDILTTQKNAVIALNNLTSTYSYLAGTISSVATSGTALLVTTGSGRLVSVSVIIPGTDTGRVNNSSTLAGVSSVNPLIAVPNTVGVFPVGMAFTAGLVLTPGTGQRFSVTYSLDP